MLAEVTFSSAFSPVTTLDKLKCWITGTISNDTGKPHLHLTDTHRARKYSVKKTLNQFEDLPSTASYRRKNEIMA